MERFDPKITWQPPVDAGCDSRPAFATRANDSFGERAIGDLVRAIVARLSPDDPCPTLGN